MNEAFGVELSRQIVADTAPEELEFFDEILASEGHQQPSGESFLGFGGDAAMVMVTSFLLTIGKEVAEFVWANGKDAAGQFVREASQSIRVSLQQKLNLWLERKAKGKAPIVLPTETLQEIARRVEMAASDQKLPNDQVTRINEWIFSRFGEG